MSLRKLTPLVLLLASRADASFLDTDFWCVNYGCAVVHDGDNYDIYDNWQFATESCCVAPGGRMISYYQRAGIPNITGTLNRIDTALSDDRGFMLGITNAAITSSDGYLDASDTLSAFSLNSATDITLDGPGRRYSHSFFVSSRDTRFSVRALASIAGASGDFAQTIGLGDIKLTPFISTRGNDGGFDYGARANASNIMIVSGVDDLGDVSGIPTQIMDFGRAIRARNGDIDAQSLRLDFLYEMPEYDMSMGVGRLDIDVTFDFYREP